MFTFVLFMALHSGGLGSAIILGAGSAYWLSDAKRQVVYQMAGSSQQPEERG